MKEERFSLEKTLLITLIVPTKTFARKRWKLSRFLMSQKLILLVLLFLKVRWTFCRGKLWFLVNSTFRLIELEILSGDDGRADLYFDSKRKNIPLSAINKTYYQGNIRFTNKARHYLIPPLQYHLKTITVICFKGIFFINYWKWKPGRKLTLTFPCLGFYC